MIIVLMGYMGSGKSSIGRELAQVLNYTFYDLDSYIEDKEQMSISDIFKTKGEIYFRKKEHIFLNEVIKRHNNIILALGGGTPCYGNNIDVIVNSQNIKSFYLKASISTLFNRLINEKSNRPLIAHLTSKDDITEFIGKHLFERSGFYSQSDFIITTDNKTISDIVEDIVFKLV